MYQYKYVFGIIKRLATRLVYIYCLLCTVAVVAMANRVSSQSLRTTKVSLSVRNERLISVLHLIEKQTPYRFSYDHEIQEIGGITLEAKGQSLKTALDDIAHQANVRYWQLNDMIAIAKEQASDQAGGSTADTLSLLPSFNPVLSGMMPSLRQSKSPVKGKIVDESGVPLAGVNVLEKGTMNGTITDTRGEYSVDVSEGAVLIFSSIGYVTQEVSVNAQAEINVVLPQDVKKLDEVVVVGYGEQKKVSLTSAVSSINARELTNVSTSNLSNILAGRASGTYVQSGTGVPGKSSVLRIRSSSSWNSAGPLIVVDGIQRDQAYFDSLDPNQVADISVLKDAASAAIYGARSSDGVLLVTTKQGKKGKPTVQYNAVFGLYSAPSILPKFLPMDEAINTYNVTHDKSGESQYNAYDKNWIKQHNPDGKMHFDEAYRTPSNQRHSINLSGGDDKIDYFVAGNIYKEKGFLPKMDFQRYNMRANVNIKIAKGLKLGMNLNYFNSTRNRFPTVEDGKDDDLSGYFMKLYYIMSPLAPSHIDGKPIKTGWITNPIEMMRNGGYLQANKQYTDAVISLEYKIPGINGLKVKGIGNLYSGNDLTKTFYKKAELYGFVQDANSGMKGIYTNQALGKAEWSKEPDREYMGNENGKTTSYQLDAMVTYDTIVGNHHFNAVGVYEQLQGYYAYSKLKKYNFPYSVTDQFTFTSPAAGDTEASGYESYLNVRQSVVGRAQYDYKEKYLLSASLRADGSYKFAKNHRWGYFPAVSAGWVISKENFMASTSGAIELLKIRASYGTTGNDNVQPWMYLDTYSQLTDLKTQAANPYYLGNANQSALGHDGIANSNYTWETSTSYNVGVDLQLLKHWNVTADFWTKSTYNILGQRLLRVPIEFGASYPVQNYGKMDAKGFELELAYTDGRIGNDFTFNVRGYVGLATTNVVVKDAPLGASEAENPAGKPLNYAVGYKDVGILRTDADVQALPADYSIFGVKPVKGMMNFKDVSGAKGIPDGKIDDYDKVVAAQYSNAPIANSALVSVNQTAAGQSGVTTQTSNNAPVSYGLTLNMRYKQFSVNALFAGLAGYKVIYNDANGRDGANTIPGMAYYANSYSEDNPNGSFPLLKRSSFNGGNRKDYSVVSGLNTFSGDFVRLKFLNIAYNLPESVLKSCRLKSVQFFVGGSNLFTLRKFKLYDPELYNFDSYPVMSSYTAGFNLQF